MVVSFHFKVGKIHAVKAFIKTFKKSDKRAVIIHFSFVSGVRFISWDMVAI